MNGYVASAIEEYLADHDYPTIVDRDDLLEDVGTSLFCTLEEDGETEAFLQEMYEDHLYYNRNEIAQMLAAHGSKLNKEFSHRV